MSDSNNSSVQMLCMTMKQKFDVENPEVIVLRNGRYAYKAKCPWQGKTGKDLYAFKFCGAQAYERYTRQGEAPDPEPEAPDPEPDEMGVAPTA